MKLLAKLRDLFKKATTREPVSGTAVIWDSEEVEKIIEDVVSEAVQQYNLR